MKILLETRGMVEITLIRMSSTKCAENSLTVAMTKKIGHVAAGSWCFLMLPKTCRVLPVSEKQQGMVSENS